MKKKQHLSLTAQQWCSLERSLIWGIETGETEVKMRSVKGTIPIKFSSAGSLAAARFAIRQQVRAARPRHLEDLQLIWCRDEGVKPAKLRAVAKHKLKNARTFRQQLDRKMKQSHREVSEDRINCFIRENWNRLVTIPNPYQLPGLCAWYPSAAVELMKRAGVLPINSHEIYDSKWFKKRRQRLNLAPVPHFLVKLS